MRHPSLLQELKTTTPAGLGMASWPIRAIVMVFWVLVLVAVGEMMVFQDLRNHLANQQSQLSDLHRSALMTEQSMDRAQAERVKQADILESLRVAYDNLGPLRPASQWLAHAEQLADALGLEGIVDSVDKGQIETLPWLSSTANNPHLQAITTQVFSADLTGHWSEVLSWLDAVMADQGQGRVWLHQLRLTRELVASSSPGQLSLRLEAILSTVGLPPDDAPILKTEHHSAQSPVGSVVATASKQPEWQIALGDAPLGAAPWGRGMDALDWWQALPLSRLTLIGTAEISGLAWAWVLDPRGKLHRVFVDTDIARPSHRVVSIQSNTVSLTNRATQAPVLWVVGEAR